MKFKIIVAAILLLPVFIQAQQLINLAGQWKFAADSLAVGEANHWERTSFTGSIHLPGSTDEIGLGNNFPLFKNALGIKRPSDYPRDADFGMLTRKHKYIGVAWYQKEIIIPHNLKDKKFSLYLERVLWRSKLWVDGELKGAPVDFLNAPHIHSIGMLSPGKHTITLMIDNREIYPVGTLAHSYCPHMQTQWNGVVGKTELQATPLLSINEVKVFPSFQNKKINVSVTLSNQQINTVTVQLSFIVREKKTQKIVASAQSTINLSNDNFSFEKEIPFKQIPLEWNEFTANLYELTTTLAYNKILQKTTTVFGFRDLGYADKHFTINGKKMEYRNSHEGMFFGKTGYPAMDKKYWQKIFELYKKHGFNSVRFHSATPPEAAFDAADELGLYLQVEFFWIDGWMGYKSLIGRSNDTLNQFVRRELHEALSAYGNHPSMVLVAIGNELGGDFNKMGEWIAEEKKADPRHLYAAGIAHKITDADDYVEYGGKADILKHTGTDWNYEENYTVAKKHNYDSAFRRKNLPEFTHEAGQYVVHPLWKEINDYKGVLEPRNLEYFKMKAAKNGIEHLDSIFQYASGNLNRIFYKAEIEATLRTKQSAGYALLGMVDYPGQGEALMGWIDPMYEVKNFITPDQFKQYGNHTVPLLRFAKFIWRDGETFNAFAEVANYGYSAIKKAVLHYAIKEGSRLVKEGYLPSTDLLQGELSSAGSFSTILSSGTNGRQLNVSIDIIGTPYKNNWDIWVFPKPVPQEKINEIIVTSSIDTAILNLKQAKRVLLIANRSGALRNKSYASFSSVFWSGTWFYDQESEVLGAVVRNEHPALRLFPTGTVLDWQWQQLCNNARGFILNDLPKNYLPIIQPVNDYHFGNKMGSLFELKTKEGGRLMVCGYNILDNADSNFAAPQLKKSILGYMNSNLFQPNTQVSDDWLMNTFTGKDKITIKPKGFENALLFVKAGGDHPYSEGEAPWEKMIDQSFNNDGFDYSVNCFAVIKDSGTTGWAGKKIQISVKVPVANLMILKLFVAGDHKNKTAIEIQCEDAPLIKAGANGKDEWINIPITRENCLDGKLEIDITTMSNRIPVITTMVLEPVN